MVIKKFRVKKNFYRILNQTPAPRFFFFFVFLFFFRRAVDIRDENDSKIEQKFPC